MLVNPIFNMLPVNQTLTSDGLTGVQSNNQYIRPNGVELLNSRSHILGSPYAMNMDFIHYQVIMANNIINHQQHRYKNKMILY